MIIDCGGCQVRGEACRECVVSVILGATPEGVEIAESQQEALGVLADAGLVPRLRHHSGQARRASGE
jgi:hypothetical protein